MRQLLIRATQQGEHWHVRFFEAPAASRTFAGLGSLVMRDPEYNDLKGVLLGEVAQDVEVTWYDDKEERWDEDFSATDS